MNYMEKFILDNIDLSVEEGLKVLASADIRKGDGGPEIYYKDNWWDLCRTDLTDNVATGSSFSTKLNCTSLDEIRNNCAKGIRYGVRLDKENNLFSIIDSWSDG